ncbi:hypothetical protein HYS50_02750 [Candidatus Woesearchaeota archaeon]|nr:hypothetical protein [Candidatus Woesearchaeota archaeon]
MSTETLGHLVSALVPKTFLLGTRLGRWYKKNPFHRFNPGDILILQSRRILGYGMRPVAVVHGYRIANYGFGIEGRYDVTLHSDVVDDGDDYERWIQTNEVPRGIAREVRERKFHFKWNIENHFRKVAVSSLDAAVALYGSIEVGDRKL